MAHAATCTCGQCGRPIPDVPLDFAYRMPDDVFALPPEDRSPRCTEDFAELQDRRFVRALLPVPIEGDEEFRYGIWIEVTRDTFDRVRRAWNDPVAYRTLEFAGQIANAFPPFDERALGAKVRLGTREERARPFVIETLNPALRNLMRRGWTRAEHRALWGPDEGA